MLYMVLKWKRALFLKKDAKLLNIMNRELNKFMVHKLNDK
jgi:hypothetical protein